MASIGLKMLLWYTTLTLLISVLCANNIANTEIGARDKLTYSLDEQNVCIVFETYSYDIKLFNYLLGSQTKYYIKNNKILNNQNS
jgi:hypothetical protein